MSDFRDTDRFEMTPDEKAEVLRRIKRRKELPKEMYILLKRIHINGLLPELADQVKAILAEIREVGIPE